MGDDASTTLSDESASPRSRRDRLSARIKNLRSSRSLQMSRSERSETSTRVDHLLSEESSFGSPTSQDARRVDSYDDAPDDERRSFVTAPGDSDSEDGAGVDVIQEEDGDTQSDSAGNDANSPARRSETADEDLDQAETAEDSDDDDSFASGSDTAGNGSDSDSSCSSAESSVPSSPASRYNRVPGGAAAKLMLMGPQRTLSEELDTTYPFVPSEGDQELTPTQTTEEIGKIMQQTKNEFAVGSASNRRYNEGIIANNSSTEKDEDMNSEAPSFLNKTEIFHTDAAAAVAAVLAPRERPVMFSDSNSVLSGQELLSVVSSGSAFKSGDSHGGGAGPISPKNSNDTASASSPPRRGQHTSGVLLSEKAKVKVESLQSRMREPDKTLSDLLTAIAEPEEGEPNSLNYTVRRKNACGAIHVLTANTSNRVPLCWTMGVLPALTSVLNNDDVIGTYPEVRHREEFLAARDRAIGTILNLSSPMANRIPVFHTPHLVPTIVSLVMHDTASARRGCAAILAFLSKTVENRLLLAKVPGLFKAIVQVILPRQPRAEEKVPEITEKKTYPWSEDDDESEGSVNRNQSYVTQETSYTSYAETVSTTHSPKDDGNTALPTLLGGYDETADEDLKQSRQFLFAVLSHLVKEKDNAYLLCRDSTLVSTLVSVACHHESKSHLLALRILANLTRHRQNTKLLVFQQRTVLPAFVRGTQSENEESRQFSCWALQNLAQDKACRQELATTEHLMECLCDRARHGGEERLASISALKNLCDEPANLIPMTNTPDCIATLMHIAHAGSNGSDRLEDTMQYRACDSLATLSHWLRKIATSGQQQQGSGPQPLIVPTLKVVTWNQWQ